MPILIVYGLPCTGKSNLIKNLPEFDNIAVDEIIRLNFSNPQISDFVNSSEEMMQHILTEIKNILEEGKHYTKSKMGFNYGVMKDITEWL